MFMGAGTIYVYLVYGIHWMINLVCGSPGHPAAVLLRGAGDVVGPGRLAKALGVDQAFSGGSLGRTSGLWVEDHLARIDPSRIEAGPRIGIDYAGDFVDKPWRFLLKR